MVRTPPQAIDIERSVLGTMLLDIEALHRAMDILEDGMFYSPANKSVYKAVVSVHESGIAPDILSVEQHLKDNGQFESIGEGYLPDLTLEAGVNIEYYVQILKEKQILRNAIQSMSDIVRRAYDNADAYDIVDQINQSAGELEGGAVKPRSLTPSEIRERDKGKPKAEKLSLGYSDIDLGIYSDGNRRGQVELTIADSGHGKTQYALFKAESLIRRGYKVAWFQLEGYDSETSDHILSSDVSDPDRIFICDSLYDIEDIKREARRLNREEGIDYNVFDYVQNIECSKNISKTERVEYISKEITKLAKELNIVCHPLSQITMDKTRSGWNCEPRYDDVRWSQQLKQDASVITSVFRPSRIDSLILNERNVKDWKDREVPYNSVFVKQAKVRHGQQEWKRLHMIHTDKGLKPYQRGGDTGQTPF